jgi:spore coat protein U-like protein
MNRSFGAALALLAMPFVMAGAANAQSSTSPVNLGVSITIEDECTVSNVVPIAFATTGILSDDVDAEGSVDVTCTTDTDYDIALSVGAGVGATAAERYLTGDGGTITYSLYPDDNYDIAWGDEVGEDTKSSTGTGSAQTHTIYGRIPSQTTPAPGAYSDTVAIVVHY